MRIIDYLRSRWARKSPQTPRVSIAQPAQLRIQARGCRIVIDENGIDKHGRDVTAIVVVRDVGLDAPDRFQLITNPSHSAMGGYRYRKSRSVAAFHVVKLKALRKPQQAKPEPREEGMNP